MYINQKDRLPHDYLFIEIDWKQKIKIGMSPRQVSREFYSQQQRTVLGCGIYYIKDDGTRDCINVNLISDNLSQKGYSVVHSFR